MGACYSCSVSPGGTPNSLHALDALDTGDVVFLHEKAAAPVYISRASSWTSFTHVGFVVRDGPGAEGAAVCHADRRTAGGSQVVRESLLELLSSGRYQVILVRRLCKRLSSDQRELAEEFVRLNLGKVAPTAASPPATVLMQAYNYTGGCERLHCSEFVATMLHLVGLVAPTPDNPREFTATHPRGYVVQQPLPLPLPLLAAGGAPGSASQAPSPRTSREHGRPGPSSRTGQQQQSEQGRDSRRLPSPKVLSREASAELAGFESDPSSRAGSRNGSRSQSRCHSRAASAEQELPLPLALEQLQQQRPSPQRQQQQQQRRTLSPRGVVGPTCAQTSPPQRAQQQRQQQQAGETKQQQQSGQQQWPAAVELRVQQALVA